MGTEKKVYEGRVFKIYPEKDSIEKIELNIEYARVTWNNLLYHCYQPIYAKYRDLSRKERAKAVRKYLSSIEYTEVKELRKRLNKIKRTDIDEKEWTRDCDSQIFPQTLRILKKAFDNYLKNPKHFKVPKFKSRKSIRYSGSYQTTNACRLVNECTFKLNKVSNKIPIYQHYPSDGRLYKVNIKKKHDETYWASLVYEQSEHTVRREKTGKSVGIDLNVSGGNYITLSDGHIYSMPFEEIKRIENKIERENRKLSKKYEQWRKEVAIIENDNKKALIPAHIPKLEERSNYQKNRLKKAKLQEHLNNIKKDSIRKICSQIANDYDIVAMEDLNVSGMIKNSKLARAVARSNFREIRDTLKYMLEWSGKKLIFVGRFYPSSKLCYECGYKNDNLTLKDREWDCPNCNAHLLRDLNAAKNIEREGLRILKEEITKEKGKSPGKI